MRFKQSVSINAPTSTVWAVLSDVERWPEWTASVTSVERLDGGAFSVGSRVRVKQPRLPVAIWRVTALEPGRFFTWKAQGAGAKTVATHRIDPDGRGGSAVTLGLDQTGLLASLIGRFFGGMVRRYMAMEARGLKARSEASATAAQQPVEAVTV